MMKGVLFMTQINFRIEEDIKENAEKALKDMGLTMSSAITMFLVKVGREKRIPFEITADPFYSESNIRYLEKIASDIKTERQHFLNTHLLTVRTDENSLGISCVGRLCILAISRQENAKED